MRIAIDVSAANDPDAHEWLDRTLYRIVDGWHVWDLTETPDVHECWNLWHLRGSGANCGLADEATSSEASS